MIDAACHPMGLHDLPVAALLVRAGLAAPLARIVERGLFDQADPAPLLDEALDEPARPRGADLAGEAVFAAGSVARMDADAATLAADVAGLAPASMLSGPAAAALLEGGAGRGGPRGRASAADRLAALRNALAARLADPAPSALLRALGPLLAGPVALAGSALARTGGDERGIVLGFGIDLEYALGERPQRPLERQLGRLAALAQRSGGRVLPFAPCDPMRPECVTVAREAIERGLPGICIADRPPGAAGVRWDREGERRIIELMRCCAELDAALVVMVDHPLVAAAAPSGARPRGGAEAAIAAWAKRCDHERFASLSMALLLAGPTIRGGPRSRRPAASVEAALALSARDARVACILPDTTADAAGDALLAKAIAARARSAGAGKRIVLGSGSPFAARPATAEDAGGVAPHLGRGAARAALLRRLRLGNAASALRLTSYAQRRAERLLGPAAAEALRERLAGRLPAPAAAVEIEVRMPPTGASAAAPRMVAAVARSEGGRRRVSGARRVRARSGGAGTSGGAASRRWDCDCLVLGAGIAGLTAARDLARPRRVGDTPRHVIVVEGSDRVGGRLHTLRSWPEGALELGAELIHRPRHDQLFGGFSLWNEIDRCRLATRSIAKLQASHVHFPAWRSAGAALRAGCGVCNDPDVAKALDVLGRVCALKQGPDKEAGAFMAELLAAHGMPRDNAEAMSDLLLTGTVPGRLGELSSAGLAFDKVKDQELSSEEHHVSAGFDALTGALAAGRDVRCGFEVVRISWGAAAPGSGVEIESDDGRVLRARAGLCTFSIGVLREGIASGRLRFDPPLPAAKLEAIDRIECGPISKIVIRFDRAFWPAGMSLLGNPRRDRQGPRSYFVPLFGVVGAAPLLTALCNGRDAREVDALLGGRPEADSGAALPAAVRSGVDAYVQRMVAELRSIFDAAGSQPAPTPLRWFVRSWANDRWTRGGTSFIRFEPGSDARAIGRLRGALADHRTTPSLYWAGEATAVGTNPWSVHGAHQSGIDAARNIHALLDLPALVP